MAGRGPDELPTPEAARAIARAGYIFLYPLVVNYGAAYAMAIDPRPGVGGFGLWHRWHSRASRPGPGRASTRQTSCTWLDLGRQPMILTPPSRGWGGCDIQWSDLWGLTPEVSEVEAQRRATQAPYLVSTCADDAVSAAIGAEVRSETRLVSVCCTQECPSSTSRRIRPGVVENPVAIPVSAYLGLGAPPASPTSWYRWHDAVLSGPDFWDCAGFALSLTRPHPDDRAFLERLRVIGVVAGADRDPGAFDESVAGAIGLGMYQAIEELVHSTGEARGGRSSPTRRQLDRDYFARAARALAEPRLGRARRGVSPVVEGQ